MARLARSLPKNPLALVFVAEQLDSMDVDRSTLPDEDVRRARAAFFSAASKGRRLAPGTSGRYVRKVA